MVSAFTSVFLFYFQLLETQRHCWPYIGVPVIYLMLEVYKIKAMTTDLSEFAGGGGVLLYKPYNIGTVEPRYFEVPREMKKSSK